jgi:hypothetical protein
MSAHLVDRDPNTLHYSTYAAGMYLARVGHPDVESCIAGLRQYSFAYEEANGQADQIQRTYNHTLQQRVTPLQHTPVHHTPLPHELNGHHIEHHTPHMPVQHVSLIVWQLEATLTRISLHSMFLFNRRTSKHTANKDSAAMLVDYLKRVYCAYTTSSPLIDQDVSTRSHLPLTS